MALDAYLPDTRCFFPDKELGWIAARLTAKSIDGDTVKLDFVDDNAKVSPPSSPPTTRRRGASTGPRLQRRAQGWAAVKGLCGCSQGGWSHNRTRRARRLPAVLLLPVSQRAVGAAQLASLRRRLKGRTSAAEVLQGSWRTR